MAGQPMEWREVRVGVLISINWFEMFCVLVESWMPKDYTE
jgi:hypothetical protein